MRLSEIAHEFVDAIPEHLDEGRLYISIRYRTASHLCACGCGSTVVTPIRPAKWKLTFDGDTVSLSPSIGNWQKACRSHYWIRNDKIVWARAWSDKEIEAGRERDARDQRRYYQLQAANDDPRQKTAKRSVLGRMSFVRLFRLLKLRP